MLLTVEQMKHLELDGEEGFRFVPHGKITDRERQMLLDLDADYFTVYNQHIITNLCALKTR